MELNIFCINKKKKQKTQQQTTTETWTDDRARQPAADDRASDSNTGRGQQAGTLGQHNWALGGILLLLLLLLLLLAARLLFQFSGDRLSLDLHLAINRLLSLDPSIDLSSRPGDCNSKCCCCCCCCIRMPNCLRADNVKHLALALALRSASSVCQIRQRKWEMNPIPVSLTLSNLHAHTSLLLFSALSQLFFRTANRFIWLIYFRILNQMPRFTRFT